jgi:hypothetical protein
MPIEIARSRPGLRNLFDSFDDDIRAHFSEFPGLVDSAFSLNVVLAYVFFRLEQGQRRVLYCGARELYKTDSELTWSAIDSEYLKRNEFPKYFQSIFGVPLPSDLQNIIRPAEQIRDGLMDGRDVDEPALREAISRVLHFTHAMNIFVDAQNVGLRPFVGDLRGFVGRGHSLDKPTSRVILKGMGFQIT